MFLGEVEAAIKTRFFVVYSQRARFGRSEADVNYGRGEKSVNMFYNAFPSLAVFFFSSFFSI